MGPLARPALPDLKKLLEREPKAKFTWYVRSAIKEIERDRDPSKKGDSSPPSAGG
jgi:hypothetical protein